MPPARRIAEPPQKFRKISASRFVIGQDDQGHWVAVDSEGREGGLFASREAAMKYVANETGRRLPTTAFAANPLLLWK